MVRRSRRNEPVVGDLVHHYIFPRQEWMAILLKILPAENSYDDQAYVKMVPGIKRENYFLKLKQTRDGYGWIYKKWLWVYDDSDSAAEIIESFFCKTR